jgi:hypothetical protein
MSLDTSHLLADVVADFAEPRTRPALIPTPDLAVGGRRFALAPPSSPTLTLGAALSVRRAVRHWRADPLQLADLSGVCGDAVAAAGNWADSARLGLAAELIVVARSVDAIPLGIYRYRDRSADLVQLIAIEHADALRAFVIQREFADAPAILVAVGPLASSLGAYGSHGYRTLLTRAGAMLGAGWLAGVRRGLAGCAFAGLLPHVLREHAGVDGFHRIAPLALAIGYPQAAQPQEQ